MDNRQSFESIKSKLRHSRKQVVRPHSARETATSANGTTDLPSENPLPRQVSARVAQGASTVEGKRLGGTSETSKQK